jgi:hypothetical protein
MRDLSLPRIGKDPIMVSTPSGIRGIQNEFGFGEDYGGFAMSNLRRMTRGFGLSSFVWFSGLVFGLSGSAWAQAYPPDGPDIPTITLNESEEGAAGLPPLEVPRPNRWD